MESKQYCIESLKEDSWHNEPWKVINDISSEGFNFGYSERHYFNIVFTNIKEYNKFPETLKFIAFDWLRAKILIYKEPELKIYNVGDFNKCLNWFKKNEEKIKLDDLKIQDDEKYKRMFFLKDINKHKTKELIKENKKIEVGDFVNTNWGYDQTNIELFKVRKILGKNYFIIQEITQTVSCEDSHLQYDLVKADESNTFIDLPVKAFISNDGYMSICENGYKRSLSVTDTTKKHYKTNPMFGH